MLSEFLHWIRKKENLFPYSLNPPWKAMTICVVLYIIYTCSAWSVVMHSEANSPDNKELDLPKQSEKKLYAAKLSYNGCYRFILGKTSSKRSELMSEFIKI